MTVNEIMERISDITKTKDALYAIRQTDALDCGQCAFLTDAESYLAEYIQELGRKKVV